MLPLVLMVKIVAIKNAVALVLINPVSRQIASLGQNNVGFQTVCRSLTHNLHTGRQQFSRQMTGKDWIPPTVTKQMELDIGSKFMAYGLITGGVGLGVITYFRRRRQHKLLKKQTELAKNECPFELPPKYKNKNNPY